MDIKLIKSSLPFLRLIEKAKTQALREELVKKFSSDAGFCDTVRKVAEYSLEGLIPFDDKTVRKLKRIKYEVIMCLVPTKSLRKKRELVRKYGGFIAIIASTLVKFIETETEDFSDTNSEYTETNSSFATNLEIDQAGFESDLDEASNCDSNSNSSQSEIKSYTEKHVSDSSSEYSNEFDFQSNTDANSNSNSISSSSGSSTDSNSDTESDSDRDSNSSFNSSSEGSSDSSSVSESVSCSKENETNESINKYLQALINKRDALASLKCCKHCVCKCHKILSKCN